MSDLVDPPHAELAPDEIAGRSFPTARRGLDADAVRRFLAEIAAQVRAQRERDARARAALSDFEARLLAAQERAAAAERASARELDEATLTAALGTETAKVLRAAHDAARDVVSKAEARAGELTGAAQEIVAKQSALAQEEADRILQSARGEADSLLSEAREDCRHMVAEAREARRRILTDLADRRRHLHVQLEQIRAAKDALVEIVDRTAGSVEDIRQHLTGSEAAARQAAEGAAGLAGALLADAVPIEQLVAEVLAGPTPVPGENGPELATPSSTEVVAEKAEDVSAQLGAEKHSLDERVERAPARSDEDDAVELTMREGRASGGDLRPAGGEFDVELLALEETSIEEALAAHEEDADVLARGAAPLEQNTGSQELVVEWIEPSAVGEAPDDRAVVAGEPAQPAEDDPTLAEPEVVVLAPLGEDPGADAQPDEAGVPGGPDALTESIDDTGAKGGASAGVPSTVDELFAKIRASRAQEVAEAREVLGVEPATGKAEVAAAPEEAAPGDTLTTTVADGASKDRASVEEVEEGEADDHRASDEPLPGIRERRDALLAPAIGELARSLKRTLRSQQNELLAATRSSGGGGLGDLLASEEVAAEIARGARPQLINAYVVGIEFAADLLGEARSEVVHPAIPEAAVVEAAIEPVVRSLADEVVVRIAGQLSEPALAGEEDPARLVGVAFREWKGERVDQLVGDAANRAFSLGILGHSTRSDVSVVWDLAENEQPCPECDDNALAEDQRPGDAFPTGHLSPPAHPGCRCVVVPVAR